MEKKQKNLENITDKTIKCLSEMASNNSVIGKPIVANEKTIIPINKLTVGILSGGGEYGDVKVVKKTETFPLSIGSGAIVSVKPSGFLVIDNKVELLKTNPEFYDSFFEKINELIGKINEKN